MAKFILDKVLDQALNYVKNNASKLIICSGQPATYAEATTLLNGGGKKLGEVAVDGTDITLGDGDANGRKIAVAAQNGVSIDDVTAGDLTWDHVAIVFDGGSELLVADPMADPRTVQNGDSVNVDPFDYEIGDPQ